MGVDCFVELFEVEETTNRIYGSSCTNNGGWEKLDRLKEKNLGGQDLFADTGFYQQLLNSYIDPHGDETEATDLQALEEEEGIKVGLTRKYLEERKRREEMQKRLKKEVDRKASKNRKIRYVVHPKLENFMAPEEEIEQNRTALDYLFG